jgi:hypothetical protein
MEKIYFVITKGERVCLEGFEQSICGCNDWFHIESWSVLGTKAITVSNRFVNINAIRRTVKVWIEDGTSNVARVLQIDRKEFEKRLVLSRL